MKLAPVPNRISTYVDTVSGFTFEKYTKDLPRGQTGTRCYHNRILICECTYVRKYSRLDGGKQAFNLVIDDMKVAQSYVKYLTNCRVSETKPVVSLDRLRDILKQAWPMMYHFEGITSKGTVFSVEYIDNSNDIWKTYFA
jgi:hypothetical protein